MEDVPLLAEHLLKEIAGECVCEVEPGALDRLLQHDWPGNVRELTHALERAYLIGSGHITADLLANEMAGIAAPAAGAAAAKRNWPAISRPPWTRPNATCLERALRTAGGNKTAAAAALGMKASTFRDKLAKHGLG